jgi:hypothetical protein
VDQTRKRADLLANFSPDEDGTWRILGEDPNCDFGGPHHQPHLATVQGKYAEVVEYALGLPLFFTWGGGGSIERVKIVKLPRASKASEELTHDFR